MAVKKPKEVGDNSYMHARELSPKMVQWMFAVEVRIFLSAGAGRLNDMKEANIRTQLPTLSSPPFDKVKASNFPSVCYLKLSVSVFLQPSINPH